MGCITSREVEYSHERKASKWKISFGRRNHSKYKNLAVHASKLNEFVLDSRYPDQIVHLKVLKFISELQSSLKQQRVVSRTQRPKIDVERAESQDDLIKLRLEVALMRDHLRCNRPLIYQAVTEMSSCNNPVSEHPAAHRGQTLTTANPVIQVKMRVREVLERIMSDIDQRLQEVANTNSSSKNNSQSDHCGQDITIRTAEEPDSKRTHFTNSISHSHSNHEDDTFVITVPYNKHGNVVGSSTAVNSNRSRRSSRSSAGGRDTHASTPSASPAQSIHKTVRRGSEKENDNEAFQALHANRAVVQQQQHQHLQESYHHGHRVEAAASRPIVPTLTSVPPLFTPPRTGSVHNSSRQQQQVPPPPHVHQVPPHTPPHSSRSTYGSPHATTRKSLDSSMVESPRLKSIHSRSRSHSMSCSQSCSRSRSHTFSAITPRLEGSDSPSNNTRFLNVTENESFMQLSQLQDNDDEKDCDSDETLSDYGFFDIENP